MKAQSPLLGFNNNVRHKGRVFHIQTEDSGVKHPHVITHLFADGGRIVRSTKTSYAEYVGDEEMPRKVRALMQEQHKAMFIALRAGKFDHLMDGIPLADAAPGHRPPMESTLSIEVEDGVKVGIPGSTPSTSGIPAASPSSKEAVPPPKPSVPQGPPSGIGAAQAKADAAPASAPTSAKSPDSADKSAVSQDDVRLPPPARTPSIAPPRNPEPSQGLRSLTPPPPARGSIPPPPTRPAAPPSGRGSVPPPRGSVPPPRASVPPPAPQRGSIPPPARESVPPPPPRRTLPPPPSALPGPPTTRDAPPRDAERRAPPPIARELSAGARNDPRAEPGVKPQPAQEAPSRAVPPKPPPPRTPLALRPSTPPPPPSNSGRVDARAEPPPARRSGSLLATLGSGVPSPPKPPSLGAAPPLRRQSPSSPSNSLSASLGAGLKPRSDAQRELGTAPTQAIPAARQPPPLPRAAQPGQPPAGRPPMSSSLDLDLEALERAAEQGHSPVYRQVRDLPPPPAAVLRKGGQPDSAYRSLTPPVGGPPQGPPSVPAGQGSGGRYAPSRPASIFGNARPQEGSSIFGEDLISEKSLDEVILSYLGEDLDAPPKK